MDCVIWFMQTEQSHLEVFWSTLFLTDWLIDNEFDGWWVSWWYVELCKTKVVTIRIGFAISWIFLIIFFRIPVEGLTTCGFPSGRYVLLFLVLGCVQVFITPAWTESSISIVRLDYSISVRPRPAFISPGLFEPAYIQVSHTLHAIWLLNKLDLYRVFSSTVEIVKDSSEA